MSNLVPTMSCQRFGNTQGSSMGMTPGTGEGQERAEGIGGRKTWPGCLVDGVSENNLCGKVRAAKFHGLFFPEEWKDQTHPESERLDTETREIGLSKLRRLEGYRSRVKRCQRQKSRGLRWLPEKTRSHLGLAHT